MNRRRFLTGAGAATATGLAPEAWHARGRVVAAGRGLHRAGRFLRRRPRSRDPSTAWRSSGSARGVAGQVGAAQAEPGRADVARRPRSTPTPPSSAPRPRSSAAGGPARSSSPRGRGIAATPIYVLDESGLGPVLDRAGLEFVDLNHDEVVSCPTGCGFTSLGRARAARRRSAGPT